MVQLAARAGVTQATVSLCLSNHPRISTATRERVQALARELGYRPHPYLSSLMRARREGKPLKDQPVLALVCAYQTADRWRTHPATTIRQMREGALECAAARGYKAQEFWLHRDGMRSDRFSTMLHARGIHGLLLSPLPDDTAPPVLAWDLFSAVSLSTPFRSINVTTVSNDHYFSSMRAVEECHRHGYRRPGLILLKSHRARFFGRWEAGFATAAAMLPDTATLAPLWVDDWSDEAAIRRWRKRERPDAIVSPGADVLLPLLQRTGSRVPRDLGVVHLACPSPGHAISGVHQNGRLIGASAVELLISMIERHERGLPTQAKALMIEVSGTKDRRCGQSPEQVVRFGRASRRLAVRSRRHKPPFHIRVVPRVTVGVGRD